MNLDLALILIVITATGSTSTAIIAIDITACSGYSCHPGLKNGVLIVLTGHARPAAIGGCCKS